MPSAREYERIVLKALHNIQNNLHNVEHDSEGRLAIARRDVVFRQLNEQTLHQVYELLHTVSTQNRALTRALTKDPSQPVIEKYTAAWDHFKRHFNQLLQPYVDMRSLVDRLTELSDILNDLLQEMNVSWYRRTHFLRHARQYGLVPISTAAGIALGMYSGASFLWQRSAYMTFTQIQSCLQMIQQILRSPGPSLITGVGLLRIGRSAADAISRSRITNVAPIRRYRIEQRPDAVRNRIAELLRTAPPEDVIEPGQVATIDTPATRKRKRREPVITQRKKGRRLGGSRAPRTDAALRHRRTLT